MDPKMKDMGKSSSSKKKKDNYVLGIEDSPKESPLSKTNGISEAKAPTETDPYEWEDETETNNWSHNQKRQVRNKTEKKRKEKIRGFINDLSVLLPPDRGVPKRQQCMNLILERTVEYMSFLKKQNQALLLEKGDEQQAEEIKRLRIEITELEHERDGYKRRAEEKGSYPEPDPSEMWDYRKEYSHKIDAEKIDLTKLIKGLAKKSNDENKLEQNADGKDRKNRGKKKKTVKSHLEDEMKEPPPLHSDSAEIQGHVLNLIDTAGNEQAEDLSLSRTETQHRQEIEMQISEPTTTKYDSVTAPGVEVNASSISQPETSTAVTDSVTIQTDQPDILALSLSGQLTPNSIGPSFGNSMDISPEAENPLQTLASVASNTHRSAVQTLGGDSVFPQYSPTTTQMTQSLNMSTNQKALNSSGQGIMMPHQNMPFSGLPNPGGGMFVVNEHGQVILVDDPSQGMMDPNMAASMSGMQQVTNIPGMQPVTNAPVAPPVAKPKKSSKSRKQENINDGSSTTVVSGTGLIMSTQVTTTAVSTPSVTTPQPDGAMTFADQNAYAQQILASGGVPQMIPLSNGQMGLLAPSQLPLLANQQPGLGMLPPGLIQGQNGSMVFPPGFPNQQMGALGQSNLPSALILPNGQIIPVVTQPSMLGVNNGVIPTSQGAPLIIPNSKANTLVSQPTGDIFVPGMGQMPNYLSLGSMAGPAQSYGGLLMTTQSMTTTAQTTMSDQSSQTHVTSSVQPTVTSSILPSSSDTFPQNLGSSIMTTQPTFASSLSQPHLLGQPPVGLPLPQFMIDGVMKNSAGQVIGHGQGQIIQGQSQMGVPNQGVMQPSLAGIPMVNSQGQITFSIPQTAASKDSASKAPPGSGMISFGPGGIPQSALSHAMSTIGQSQSIYAQSSSAAVNTKAGFNNGGGILTSSNGVRSPSVSSGPGPQTVQVISSNGTLYLTLPQGAQHQGPIIIDPSSLPMLQPKVTSSAGPPIAPAPPGVIKGKNKKGQRVLMPKPPINMMHPMWQNQVYITEKLPESNREEESQPKIADDKDKMPEITATQDILAKAAESIFSSSMADISPTMYGSPDQQLHIDTTEQHVVTKKDSARNRSRRKKPAAAKAVKVQKVTEAIVAQKEVNSENVQNAITLSTESVESVTTKANVVVSTSGNNVRTSPTCQYSMPLSIVVPESNSTPITSNSTPSSGMTSLNIPDLSARLLSFTRSVESTKVSNSNCSTPTSNAVLEETKLPVPEVGEESKNLQIKPMSSKDPTPKSRKRNSSKKNIVTSPKIKPCSLPETIMFSEADLSDVLDQVENLDIPNVSDAPQKPGRSQGKKNKVIDRDDSGKPEKKKRKQNNKNNEYDFQDDVLPEDPGLHIDLDPPSLTESSPAHVVSPLTKVVTSAPSTPAAPSIEFVSPRPVAERAPTPEVLPEPEPEKMDIPVDDQEEQANKLLDSLEEMIQAPSSVNSAHQPSPAMLSSPAMMSPPTNDLPELSVAKSESASVMETLGLMTSMDVSQPSQMSPPKLTTVMSPLRLPSPLPEKSLSETVLESFPANTRGSFPTNTSPCVTPPSSREILRDTSNDQPLGNPSLFADVPITKDQPLGNPSLFADVPITKDQPLGNPSLFADVPISKDQPLGNPSMFADVPVTKDEQLGNPSLFADVPITKQKVSPEKQTSMQSPGFADTQQISHRNNFNPYEATIPQSIEMDIPSIEVKNTSSSHQDSRKSLEELPTTSLANQMSVNSANQMSGNSTNHMSGTSANQLPGNAQPPYLSHSVESLFGSTGNRKETSRTPDAVTGPSAPEKEPVYQEPVPAPPVQPAPAPVPAPLPPPQKTPSKSRNYQQNTGSQSKKKSRRSAPSSQPNFYSAENLLHSQNHGRHPLHKDMPPMFPSQGGEGGIPCNMPPRNEGFNCNPLFLPPSSSGTNMPPTSMPFNMPSSSSGMQPPPFSFSLSSSSSSAPRNSFSPQSSQFSFYPLHPPSIMSHNSGHGSIPGSGPPDTNIGLNLPQFGMENPEQNNTNREMSRPNQVSLTSPPQVSGNPSYPNFNRPTNNTRVAVHHGPGRNQFMEPAPPLMHNDKELENLPPPLQQRQFNMADSRRPEMNSQPTQSFPEMGRSPSNMSDPGSQRLMPDMGRHPPQFTDIPPHRMNPSQPRHPETSPSQPNFSNHPNSGSRSQNRQEMNLSHSRPSDMGRSRRQSDGGHSRMNDMGQSPRMGEIIQSPNRESSQGPKHLSDIPPPLNSQPRSRPSSITSRSPHAMNNMPGPGPFFHSPGSTFVNQGPPPPELTSPPLRHPSRGPFEAGNFNNQPPQDFNPMLNFGTSGFDPPPLELRETNPPPPPPTSQSSAFNSNQAPPSQSTKSTNQRSESTRAPKRTSSAKTTTAKPRAKSKKQTQKQQQQQQQQQQYEMDTNLQNSIFEPNRSMTPYFPISNMSSPPPRNMQGDGPTYIGNLFGGPSRPLSNTGPSPHHKNPEVNAPFNSLFPPGRPQNGLGLNFQPPGFGMNHMHGNHGNPGPIPPHGNSVSVTPHMPNFNLSNFFQDINNPGQNDSINISPIKFTHGNPILNQQGIDHQLQHHHQSGMFHNRPPPPVLHNAISLLGHQHHGFDSRQVGQPLNSSMGPPFHGHGGAPSFGMPPGLNFNMHDH